MSAAAATAGAALTPCGEEDFKLFHLATREANGWALLGELGKWVAVSPARFRAVAEHADGLEANVAGAPGEEVVVSFLPPRATEPVHVRCTVGPGGAATVTPRGCSSRVVVV